MALQLSRWTTLVGYFGLLILLLNWFSWISPPQQVPRALILIVLVVPLMFPLRGLLHGKTYTHAWTSFLSLFYFAIGVDIAYTVPADRWLATAMTVFSLLLFTGSIFFPYYTKKAKKARQENPHTAPPKTS